MADRSGADNEADRSGTDNDTLPLDTWITAFHPMKYYPDDLWYYRVGRYRQPDPARTPIYEYITFGPFHDREEAKSHWQACTDHNLWEFEWEASQSG